MNKNFVLKGHICYSQDKSTLKVYENSYLVCVDGKSKGVFENLPMEYKELPLKDYGDKLIIPGMIDLHVHAPQYAFRGMCMDLELMDWLNQYTFPEEESLFNFYKSTKKQCNNKSLYFCNTPQRCNCTSYGPNGRNRTCKLCW